MESEERNVELAKAETERSIWEKVILMRLGFLKCQLVLQWLGTSVACICTSTITPNMNISLFIRGFIYYLCRCRFATSITIISDAANMLNRTLHIFECVHHIPDQ